MTLDLSLHVPHVSPENPLKLAQVSNASAIRSLVQKDSCAGTAFVLLIPGGGISAHGLPVALISVHSQGISP